MPKRHTRAVTCALAPVIAVGLILGLTGCGDGEEYVSKWDRCIEAGGSPKQHPSGTDCIMPDLPAHLKEW